MTIHDRPPTSTERRDLYNTEMRELYAEYKKNSRVYTRKFVSQQKTEIIKNVSIPIIAATSAGTGVGFVCGIPGGPAAMIAGAGVGGLTGFAIGSAISGGLVYHNYTKWKKKYTGTELEETLRFFFQHDSVLKEFVCPITTTIIKTAVMTEDGKFYEKDAIIQWITEQTAMGRTPTCPLTKKTLTLNMLRDAPEASATICSRLIVIIDQESQLEGLDKRVLEGLKAIHSDLKKFIDHQHKLSLKEVKSLRKRNRISSLDLKLETARLYAAYFNPPIGGHRI